jgi:hypothetical protein
MKISVLYDLDIDNARLFPLWMMINYFTFDWTKTIYINIETPFERFTFDEIESDVLALSVPDHVYVRHPHDPTLFGIHLPSLRNFIIKTLDGSGRQVDLNDIQRLMLRVTDIEDVLEAEIRSKVQWK